MDLQDFIDDTRPIVIRVDGKVFRVEPFSFNKAIMISKHVGDLVSEYSDILKEGGLEGSSEMIDRALDVLLGEMRFNGLLPDFYCRWWIKRRAKKHLAPIDRADFVKELSRLFLRCLLVKVLTSRPRKVKTGNQIQQ